MAFTCGFFNNLNNNNRYKYNAEQLSSIFDGIISDGMYANYKQAMIVKASDIDNEVIVQPGRAWLMHTWSYNDADLPIVAPEPELVLDRIDALVLDVNIDPEVRWNEIKWVQGTPASQDVQRPTLINEEFHRQYPLCYVYRAAGSTTIAQENITNAIGTSEFPFVTGIIETIDVEDLLIQWENQWENWMARNEAQMTSWMNQSRTAFESWFANLQNELDSNQAAHLQHEIDDGLDGLKFRVMSYSEHESGTFEDGTVCLCYEDEEET